MHNEGNETDGKKPCTASLSLVTAQTTTGVKNKCHNSVLSVDMRGVQCPRFYRCLTQTGKQLTFFSHSACHSGKESAKFYLHTIINLQSWGKDRHFHTSCWEKVVWNGVCYLEPYLSVWDEVRSAGSGASCLALLPLCFLAYENQVSCGRKQLRKFFSKCSQTMSHTNHLWPCSFCSPLCCIIPDTPFFCFKWDWWCILAQEFPWVPGLLHGLKHIGWGSLFS